MQNIKKVGIEFEGKIRPLKPVNPTMTLCKCFVLALGKNRKKINISKEAVEDAMPTLFNIPVVGHIYVDDDDELLMGGHDKKIVKDADGRYKFKKLTVPYGVVPADSTPHYEIVKEDDGEERTYLVCDIILWTKMYPELLDVAYGDDIYFNQSMEVYPLSTSRTSDGYINFNKYQYEALCLLGKRDDSKNVEPCFPSASVQPYFSAADIWSTLFEEFKRELAEGYGKEYSAKGEKSSMKEEFLKVLSEFGIEDASTLPFELDADMTEESLREKLESMKSSDPENGSFSNDAGNGEPDTGSEEEGAKEFETEPAGSDGSDKDPIDEDGANSVFSLPKTASEKRESLARAVDSASKEDDGVYIRYYMIDYTDEFVIYERNVYSKNGESTDTFKAPYRLGEDGAYIDFESVESVRLVWLTKEEEARASEKEREYEELISFKAQREEEDKRKEYGEAISEFSDLEQVEEYRNLVSHAMEFSSVDELKEKLYAIRGKSGIFKKQKTDGIVRIPVNFSKEDTSGDSDEEKFYKRFLPQGKK